jgi:hypothetical protein
VKVGDDFEDQGYEGEGAEPFLSLLIRCWLIPIIAQCVGQVCASSEESPLSADLQN